MRVSRFIGARQKARFLLLEADFSNDTGFRGAGTAAKAKVKLLDSSCVIPPVSHLEAKFSARFCGARRRVIPAEQQFCAGVTRETDRPAA